MARLLLRACRVIRIKFGGCDGAGASWPRSRLRASQHAGIDAAVDEKALPGDVAGLGGEKKAPGGAESTPRPKRLAGTIAAPPFPAPSLGRPGLLAGEGVFQV